MREDVRGNGAMAKRTTSEGRADDRSQQGGEGSGSVGGEEPTGKLPLGRVSRVVTNAISDLYEKRGRRRGVLLDEIIAYLAGRLGHRYRRASVETAMLRLGYVKRRNDGKDAWWWS